LLFSSAINSLTSFAGTEAFTISTFGTTTISPTGCKSLSGS